MIKFAAMNIETDGNTAMLEVIPEPDVKFGRMKDPTKKQEKVEEAKQKQLSSMALDPTFGRVLCVTFSTLDDQDDTIKTVTQLRTDIAARDALSDDDAERRLLAWASRQLEKIEQLVTFNGAGFDIPFVVRRGVLLNVLLHPVEMNRYRCAACNGTSHTDLMQLLHNHETGFGNSNPMQVSRSLSYYAKHILGEDWPYRDVDQSRLGEMAGNGEADTVRKLCEWNTEQTLRLFKHLRPHYS